MQDRNCFFNPTKVRVSAWPRQQLSTAVLQILEISNCCSRATGHMLLCCSCIESFNICNDFIWIVFFTNFIFSYIITIVKMLWLGCCLGSNTVTEPAKRLTFSAPCR